MIKIETKGINTLVKKFDELSKEGKTAVQSALNTWADATSAYAIRLAPSNKSGLRLSIHPEYGVGFASVVASAKYAAYIEFGTRKFATSYVSSLPQDWETYANTFKGPMPNGGNFDDLLLSIIQWCEDKGIDKKAAYPIARKIMRDGIKPQPFLYPSVLRNTPILIQDIKDIYS